MTFRRPPTVLVRSRDQLRAYITRKMAEEFPPAEIRAIERTYRAFRLIGDTVDLRRTMLDLYDEQVAGFYDPDSSALFVVRGADPSMWRLVMAHELVHALQDQHTRIGPILKLRRQNDRQMAGQAVFEGQAMLASVLALQPGTTVAQLREMWGAMRQQIRAQQSSMPVFARAPLLIRESLIFPYVAGADFYAAFDARRTRPDEQPYRDALPVSTEQILHPSRYTASDVPRQIVFAPPLTGDTIVYEDNFGEFEMSVALRTWGVAEDAATAAASGWDGDRYRVLGTPAGTALMWITAWDSEADAADFERRLASAWPAAAAGRRRDVARVVVSGTHVVRLVEAPAAWAGWRRLPAITLR